MAKFELVEKIKSFFELTQIPYEGNNTNPHQTIRELIYFTDYGNFTFMSEDEICESLDHMSYSSAPLITIPNTRLGLLVSSNEGLMTKLDTNLKTLLTDLEEYTHENNLEYNAIINDGGHLVVNVQATGSQILSNPDQFARRIKTVYDKVQTYLESK
jgi:hypothetical protein